MDLNVPKSSPIFLLSLSLLCLIRGIQSFRDMRYVSYEDIHMSSDTQMFHKASISSYLHPLFHSSLKQIIFAAKNHLIRLHTSNLSTIEIVAWKPQDHHKTLCANKGMSSKDCENYIKLLVLHKEEVIVCGTHALSPQCSWRNATSLSQIFKNESGLGRSPYNRYSNLSFLMTSSGDLYTALPLDAGGFDSAIVRNVGSSVHLRTDKSNSFWLDKPEFVGMFESGEHVYIFFREVAVEKISCGKSTVSRVARICKSDRGGTSWVLKNNWVTFLKASLNCSRPGEYPFYYDEMQDVHFDEDRNIFTAVFTTPTNSLYGSAVCEYSLDAISQAMAGNLKVYNVEQKIWKNMPSQHGKICPSEGGEQDSSLKHLDILAANQHQLAENYVQPLQIHPIIERPNERYNKIDVEVTHGKFRNKSCELKIIYMATFEGLINKFVIVPNNHSTTNHRKRKHSHHHHRHHVLRKREKTACFLESIQLLPLDQPQAINFLKINPNTKHLVIGTESRIYQIPRFRCQKFRTKTTCEAAQDPHCQWIDSLCQSTPTPSISSCPLTHLIGKTWYGWSEWSDCSVTCGQGVQMRMLICLSDLKQLAHTSDLKHSLKCAGRNYVTRTCKMKHCPDHTTSTWSSWLVNENKEERYRCLCKEGEKNKGCKAVLQRSERKCKNEKKCGMRPKRLAGRGLKRSYSRHKQRYNQFSNLAYNSRFLNKSNSNLNLSVSNRIDLLTNKKVLNTKKLRKLDSTNYSFNNNLYLSNNAGRTHLQSQTYNLLKVTKTALSNNTPVTTTSHTTTSHTTTPHTTLQTAPCPNTCDHQIPAHMGIFYGYCGCRDMGVFRVCHKCNSDRT